MLAWPGGKERSADEFRALFAGAGFELTKIVPTNSPLSVVEAVAVVGRPFQGRRGAELKAPRYRPAGRYR